MSFGPTPSTVEKPVSYNIYGNILGGFCVGPLFALTKIEVSNELVWSGRLLHSANPGPVEIDIPGRGIIELYWGDESQALSSWFVSIAAAAGHIHPNYRGIPFIALKRFLFGPEMYSANNIRLAGVRQPVQSLITGAAADLIDDQANPWVVLAERLTHPLFGLAHPLAIFHAPSWQACADACIPRAAEVYVSMKVDSQVNGRTTGANLLSLCQGYMRPQRGTGLIEAGMFPNPSTINPASLPTITSQQLSGPLESTPETWDDVKTRTLVSYKNRDLLYKSDVAKYDDPRAKRWRGSMNKLELELPIVRSAQAETQARYNGRLRALPGCDYTAPVRAAVVADWLPGSHCILDIDPVPGGTQLLQVCRINSIDRPVHGSATLELSAERTLTPLAYTPADEPGGDPTPDVPPVAVARFVELSPQASDGDDGALAILAQRPGEMVTDLLVYYDAIDDNSSTYPQVLRTRAYALRCDLDQSIDGTDTAIVLNMVGALNREIVESSPGVVAARNNSLLLFLIGPLDETGGIYNRPVEIISIIDIAAVDTDQLDLNVLRARLGTAAGSYAVGTEAWVVARSDLAWFRHADFDLKISTGQLCYFKLQPATAVRALGLDEITPASFRFNSVRAFAPVITTTTPEVDSGETFTSCAIAERLTVTGSITDIDSNLVALSIVSVIDGYETVLLSKNYGGEKLAVYASDFTPPAAGIYQIIIRATDSTGRTTEAVHEIHCALSSSPRCAEPTFEEITTSYEYSAGGDGGSYPWYDDFHVTIRCATAAVNSGASSTIKLQYARVPIGTPVEAVTWTDHTVNVNRVEFSGRTGYMSGGQYVENLSYRVWARAVDTTSTLADSYPVYFDGVHG
jgi:hypothetical protein